MTVRIFKTFFREMFYLIQNLKKGRKLHSHTHVSLSTFTLTAVHFTNRINWSIGTEA